MKTKSEAGKISQNTSYKAGIIAATLLLAIGSRAELPTTITTTDGQTYNGVSLVRAEPDGYLVNYKPQDNGMGMAKIKFSRLSSDLQKQAGYDADKAKKFETDVAKANEDWRQESIKYEQTVQAEIKARQASELQEEQLALQRMTAMTQMRMAQAGMDSKNGENNNAGGYGYEGGYGAIAVPVVYGGSGSQRPYHWYDGSFYDYTHVNNYGSSAAYGGYSGNYGNYGISPAAYPLGRTTYVQNRAIRPPFTPSR